MTTWRAVALLLFLWMPTVAWPCSGACGDDSDCIGNACRYCDTGFGVCADCCEFTEEVVCPSICTWTSGECRNDSGTGCGISVAELPARGPAGWVGAIAAAAALGAAWTYRRIKRRRS